MKIHRMLLLACCSLAATSFSLHAAGDPDAGRQKAGNCMGCHGVTSYFNVYPTYRVPRLGGQHPEYIVAALTAYKNGERNHATMAAQAANLSEQDMQDLASYFASFGSE